VKHRRTIFLCSVGTGAVSIKSTSGQVTSNFCFLLPLGYAGHVAHSSESGV
jgi:hypothetical protein